MLSSIVARIITALPSINAPNVVKTKNHMVYRCCGNRHCPNCQHHKTRKWLQTQLDRQLPGHHFMITFTVPQNLRRFIRSHQKVCYSAMFAASSQTIKKLAADQKHIGGDMPGFFGVLHTWGRQMPYHPHILTNGSALESIFSCRSRPCQKSSRPNSATL